MSFSHFHTHSHMNMADYDLIMVKVYAKLLAENLDSVVEPMCYGCVINHGSQKQHDICLLPVQEKIIHCLDASLGLMNEEQVLKDFIATFTLSQLFRCPDEFFYDNFRYRLRNKRQFIEDVTRKIAVQYEETRKTTN